MTIYIKGKSIIVNEEEVNKLELTKHSSFNMSLEWKKQSKKLFDGSSDFESFSNAIMWCGTYGNVARTVHHAKLSLFFKFLFDNKGEILEGRFSLSDTPKYKYKSKKGKSLVSNPRSWVSKICHILNPYSYPLIYDSRIRENFNIDSIDDFNETLDDVKSQLNSGDDPYFLDSYIWALYINKYN